MNNKNNLLIPYKIYALHFQGNYTATGADLSLLIKYGNFPKVVFYGLYKFRQSFLMNKELRGCVLAVVNIRRPWELD